MLLLLYACPHPAMCVLILYICVLILLCVSSYHYVCPHTTTCVLILQRLAEKEEMELLAARERIASLKKGNARHLEQMRRQACRIPPAYAVHTAYSSSSSSVTSPAAAPAAPSADPAPPGALPYTPSICSTHSIQ